MSIQPYLYTHSLKASVIKHLMDVCDELLMLHNNLRFSIRVALTYRQYWSGTLQIQDENGDVIPYLPPAPIDPAYGQEYEPVQNHQESWSNNLTQMWEPMMTPAQLSALLLQQQMHKVELELRDDDPQVETFIGTIPRMTPQLIETVLMRTTSMRIRSACAKALGYNHQTIAHLQALGVLKYLNDSNEAALFEEETRSAEISGMRFDLAYIDEAEMPPGGNRPKELSDIVSQLPTLPPEYQQPATTEDFISSLNELPGIQAYNMSSLNVDELHTLIGDSVTEYKAKEDEVVLPDTSEYAQLTKMKALLDEVNTPLEEDGDGEEHY